MSVQDKIGAVPLKQGFMIDYLEALSLVERLHRLLLDVIKDEFERVGVIEINAVQGLLLFNIGDNEVTAGELKSRGYYQGSNVSYNLKSSLIWGSCTTSDARLTGAACGSGSPKTAAISVRSWKSFSRVMLTVWSRKAFWGKMALVRLPAL